MYFIDGAKSKNTWGTAAARKIRTMCLKIINALQESNLVDAHYKNKSNILYKPTADRSSSCSDIFLRTPGDISNHECGDENRYF